MVGGHVNSPSQKWSQTQNCQVVFVCLVAVCSLFVILLWKLYPWKSWAIYYIVLQSRYVNRGRSFTPTTSYTTTTTSNTHLEDKLQLISKQLYPPKPATVAYKNWYFPMFSRHLEVFFQLQKLFQQTSEPWEDSPALTHRKFSTQPMCRPVRPRRALATRGIANFVRWFCVIFLGRDSTVEMAGLDFSGFAGMRWEGQKI